MIAGGQKIVLSTTGAFAGEGEVVYDSGDGFGPPETIDGNAFVFASVAARYVRHYCAGSTANHVSLQPSVKTVKLHVSSLSDIFTSSHHVVFAGCALLGN